MVNKKWQEITDEINTLGVHQCLATCYQTRLKWFDAKSVAKKKVKNNGNKPSDMDFRICSIFPVVNAEGISGANDCETQPSTVSEQLAAAEKKNEFNALRK